MKKIGTIAGVDIMEEKGGRVFFTAKAAIDADGANGQGGKRAAYMTYDRGLDYLANGGMFWSATTKRVLIGQSWAKNIVIMAGDQPREFPGGIIASMTTYRHRDKAQDDPRAYVDSATVPYIVVPPLIRQKTVGIVLGCLAKATNNTNGKSVMAAVIDIGPRTKIGELSIAAAEALGIPSSPRNGGTDNKIVTYELFPGTPADGFSLQAA